MKQTRRSPETGSGRARIAIHGAVQGVGFRYFVRQAARALDLAGYVRNRRDGAVELEAAGAGDALAELLRTSERGPPLARVKRVEVLEASAEVLPTPFAIRH